MRSPRCRSAGFFVLAALLVACGACAGEAVRRDDEVIVVQVPQDVQRPAAERLPPPGDLTPLIVDRTNAFRRENRLPPLKPEDRLTAAAQVFAEYMARTHKYGHTADGREPSERVEEQKYDYCLVTENIAYQFDSDGYETAGLAGQFVQGWIDSPGHRKNMLDPDATETGVGVARSDEGQYFAVQLFARPEAARIQFSIRNDAPAAVRYTVDGTPFDLPPRMTRKHGVCRPPELRIATAPGRGEQVIRPGPGSLLVLSASDNGAIRITQR